MPPRRADHRFSERDCRVAKRRIVQAPRQLEQRTDRSGRPADHVPSIGQPPFAQRRQHGSRLAKALVVAGAYSDPSQCPRDTDSSDMKANSARRHALRRLTRVPDRAA
jgi:hypothetical protein